MTSISAMQRSRKLVGHAGTSGWSKEIGFIHTLTSCDVLYIGGGNSKHLKFELPPWVRIVSNEAGITGGIRLWDAKLDDMFPAT